MSLGRLLIASSLALLYLSGIAAAEDCDPVCCSPQDVFLDMMCDSNPAMRAAGLAGYWASMPERVDGLDQYLDMLDDPDEDVWQLAFDFAWDTMPAGDLRYLRLLDISDPDYRWYVLWNMPLSIWVNEDAAVRLLALLDDPDPRFAARASTLLYQMGDGAKPAVPLLRERVESTEGYEQEQYILGLGRMNQFSIPIVREYLESATVADMNFQTMLHLTESIGAAGAELAPLLRELVRDSDYKIGFSMASGALGAVSRSDPELIAEIFTLAEQTEGVPRSAALDALGYIGWPVGESAESLWQYTTDPSRPVRVSAIKALAEIRYGLEEHIEDLLALSADPDLSMTALMMLSEIGEPAVEPLLELFACSDDEQRLVIWRALERAGAEPEVLVPPLLELLENPTAAVVCEALKMLQQTGPAGAVAVPKLVLLLQNGTDAVIEQSIYALQALGPLAVDAVPALRELTHHPIFGDRAAWAIESITSSEDSGQ